MKNRHIAHITIEADTPLKVGSNASDFLQDSPVQKDWNGLPMILGTSIAGVLRKDFQGNKNKLFGDENSNKKDAKGSELIISNALLCIDNENKVCEELLLEKSTFLKKFDNLPIREHTAITDKGVAKEHSKFDEEIVYKGTRFKFSIEMIEDEKSSFEDILNLLSSSSFRLGGGSTKGFGKFKIHEIRTQSFDETNYEEYSSSLNHTLNSEAKASLPIVKDKNYINYTLNITPDDFFMFGSGFGDSDADSTQVYEKVVDYGTGELSDEMILIPASSIKGALAHRAVFHYNSIKGNTIESNNGISILENIFGEAKNSKKDIAGSKGKVIFSDCYKKDKKETKVFDHVCIDRFTGGAMNGALFQEKTIAQKNNYKIEILLHVNIKDDEQKAFEKALLDITTGMLPLGGMTTKGHGVFIGILLKDGKEFSCEL